MPQYAAIKIHYDHRPSLPVHLKYSVLPNPEEYREYLRLFRDEGIGGNGFHECLNFSIPPRNPVRIYLPPTCLPSAKKANEEFIIFSFTYKDDKDLSAHIIGVHAGVRMLSIEPGGVDRPESPSIAGVESLHYHAEAPPELVTLFTSPLSYDHRDGLYTPAYERWGFGRRYVDDHHAAAIISAAYREAADKLSDADISLQTVIQRQLDVLARIDHRYSLGALKDIHTDRNTRNSAPVPISAPDKEIGYLGERYIYEQELAYVAGIGRNANEVEWISQSAPTSPFDIKTIRVDKYGVKEHFIEVKSSAAFAEDSNVYLSQRQIEFMKENKHRSNFSLVSFDRNRRPIGVKNLSVDELFNMFDTVPIKFKLVKRDKGGR
jgi:hypothetical protein